MPPIRVLSIVEAWFVTGQAKNLIEFAQRSKTPTDGIRGVGVSLATYERGVGAGEKNQFVIAARQAEIPLDLITERRRFDSFVLTRIREIVAARNPDIIQTHNVKSHFLMRYSGLWRTRKWLAFHHGYTTTDLKMRCYNQLDRWSLRAADHVVTVCGAFAHELNATGIPRERILVRHNSVPPFTPPEPGLVEHVGSTFPAQTPLFVVVGRLSKEKGHADLLRAFGALRWKTPLAFHAVFVGDGPERRALEILRAKLGLENIVTMVGLQHDVRPYYSIATAVVLPSHSEGSPNVLLEAMAAGVPVVATRVGGVPEIAVDSIHALLVDARNHVLMAAALRQILEDPYLRRRLAENARQLVETKYSPEAHRRALVEIYERVLENPRRTGPVSTDLEF